VAGGITPVHSQLESSVFDLSFLKIAVLAVIALVIFGPDQLPKMAVQAGRALRDFRRVAEAARADLQQHLPDEFREFDLNELNPKYFVRKHLLDEVANVTSAASAPVGVGAITVPTAAQAGVGAEGGAGAVPGVAAAAASPASAGVRNAPAAPSGPLTSGENPPWDDEAT
jgi:sec-independent protein translocase protein TatB